MGFKAWVLNQKDGGTVAALQELDESQLPAGDVLVDVAYTCVNYKDGLAVTGAGKVVRSFPMVPGIDLSGVVAESASPLYKPGDRVLLTGWGVGERHWGGFAQKARVKADWLLPLPDGYTLQQAMGLGTAGLTAMLCAMALEEHGLRSGGREVVVTGAAGGVGSVAVAILARLGHRVVASTGRAAAHGWLRALGAHECIDRSVLAAPGRHLESERWGGAVDTVGGDTLAGLLRSLAYGSAVAACGLAGGHALSTTVFPFILRGVSLLGIDSVYCPNERRRQAWARLAELVPGPVVDQITQTVGMGDVPAACAQIVQGQVRGRIVIDVNARAGVCQGAPKAPI